MLWTNRTADGILPASGHKINALSEEGGRLAGQPG